MNSPQISIVLPTFNGQHYLAEAIESCLNQTFSNFELIIVDDASTDDTPQMVQRYIRRDPRVKGIRHSTNRKLPAALNTGFRAARGQFFTWNSDDNTFHPNALERLLSELSGHPEKDIAFSDFDLMDSAGRVGKRQTMGGPSQIFEKNSIGACFLYKRIVHEQLSGFAEDLFLVEDYDFWLRAATRYSFSHVHESLMRYRVHEGSLTQKKYAEIQNAYARCLYRFCSKNIDLISLSNRLSLFRRMFVAGWYLPPSRRKRRVFQLIFQIAPVLFFQLLAIETWSRVRQFWRR